MNGLKNVHCGNFWLFKDQRELHVGYSRMELEDEFMHEPHTQRKDYRYNPVVEKVVWTV